MLAYFLLLLPTLQLASCSVIINEYAVKQVKIDDDSLKLFLSKLYPGVIKLARSEAENNCEPLTIMSRPEYENSGQKLFTKVYRDKEKLQWMPRSENIKKNNNIMKYFDIVTNNNIMENPYSWSACSLNLRCLLPSNKKTRAYNCCQIKEDFGYLK